MQRAGQPPGVEVADARGADDRARPRQQHPDDDQAGAGDGGPVEPRIEPGELVGRSGGRAAATDGAAADVAGIDGRGRGRGRSRVGQGRRAHRRAGGDQGRGRERHGCRRRGRRGRRRGAASAGGIGPPRRARWAPGPATGRGLGRSRLVGRCLRRGGRGGHERGRRGHRRGRGRRRGLGRRAALAALGGGSAPAPTRPEVTGASGGSAGGVAPGGTYAPATAADADLRAARSRAGSGGGSSATGSSAGSMPSPPAAARRRDRVRRRCGPSGGPRPRRRRAACRTPDTRGARRARPHRIRGRRSHVRSSLTSTAAPRAGRTYSVPDVRRGFQSPFGSVPTAHDGATERRASTVQAACRQAQATPARTRPPIQSATNADDRR